MIFIERNKSCIQLMTHPKSNGLREGIARGLSQMVTYPFEAKKAYIQVGKIAPIQFIQCYKGIFQSSLSSGFVFASYFNIYNTLHPYPFSSSIASFFISFIKIPIANCMRILQINPHHKHAIESGNRIFKKRGIKGLYNGYSISLIEDAIETTVRNTIYETFKTSLLFKNQNVNLSLITGAFAGAAGAAFTTPFDTIRTNMAHASIENGKNDLFHVSKRLIFSKEGPIVLFRGMKLRATSNAVRYALFYLIMEYLYVL